MNIPFTKMQGLGNDYIYINCIDNQRLVKFITENIYNLAPNLCHRNFGIGGDGIILISTSRVADFAMMMYNRDGSQGLMCGNGIRCVGKYLWDNGISDKSQLSIQTKSGIRQVDLISADNRKLIGVEMGRGKILEKDRLKIKDKTYDYTLVNVGNNHCVIFTTDIYNIEIDTFAYLVRDYFPQIHNLNIELAEKTTVQQYNIRVHENGSGETLSCGTGACAVAFSAISSGLANGENPTIITMKGGSVKIITGERGIYMIGSCETVFQGSVHVNPFNWQIN